MDVIKQFISPSIRGIQKGWIILRPLVKNLTSLEQFMDEILHADSYLQFTKRIQNDSFDGNIPFDMDLYDALKKSRKDLHAFLHVLLKPNGVIHDLIRTSHYIFGKQDTFERFMEHIKYVNLNTDKENTLLKTIIERLRQYFVDINQLRNELQIKVGIVQRIVEQIYYPNIPSGESPFIQRGGGNGEKEKQRTFRSRLNQLKYLYSNVMIDIQQTIRGWINENLTPEEKKQWKQNVLEYNVSTITINI